MPYDFEISDDRILQRPCGRSGLMVSVLGLGAVQISDAGLEEAEVASLLNAAVDADITQIDTARSYGLEVALRFALFTAPGIECDSRHRQRGAS